MEVNGNGMGYGMNKGWRINTISITIGQSPRTSCILNPDNGDNNGFDYSSDEYHRSVSRKEHCANHRIPTSSIILRLENVKSTKSLKLELFHLEMQTI